MKKLNHSEHVPHRTCIACREVRPKLELVRIVNNAEDGVVIDLTGKKSGRGTYICNELSCWEKGLKWNRLEHALKTQISEQKRQQLSEYSKTFLK